MIRMQEIYRNTVRPELIKRFGYANAMQAPKIEKIVVNMGVKEAPQDAKVLDAVLGDLAVITGQKPNVRRARKSIANFKIREGMPVGGAVTLRGRRMWDFYDRLVNVAIPRIRDFRGVPTKSFDGHGNYTLGVEEQIVFPEIDYDKVSKIQGMDIVIVTSARSDEEAYALLDLLGMPFRRR
ncbi:MAG: 50S ribosomal protein L5 [Candidatus Eisenbacteria bacterium]|nr:50S ribosomal protein L5 [Candidatus Eisenbacteria bacterium]